MMTSITKLIDDAISKRKEHFPSGKINPSSMGTCYRAQYWKRKGIKLSNPFDLRSLRIFKAGELFHDFVQDLLTDFEIEVPVVTDNISGRADIVVSDEVIDIKSVHSKAFWYMNKPGYSVEKEKHANILQVMIYAKLLNKPKGRLIFISKDDLCTSEYVFYLNKWEKKVDLEIKHLEWFWKNNVLPKPKPRAYKTECQRCLFRDLCKREGDYGDY